MKRRVIVTGSRHWPNRQQVWAELDSLAEVLTPGDHLTLMHGGCPTGADRAAANWWHAVCEQPSRDIAESRPVGPGKGPIVIQPVTRWKGRGPIVEMQTWLADWDHCTPECVHAPRRNSSGRLYCPQAGPRRNAQMVAAGADLLLAFPLSSVRRESPGTWHCVGLAAAARIPYRRIYPRR